MSGFGVSDGYRWGTQPCWLQGYRCFMTLVADQLKALGVKGILITAAEQGKIRELVCQMPECFCPTEIGGANYFEPVTGKLTDWSPTHDHYPKMKSEGGHRKVENTRLAHRLCNRVDYSKTIGRSYAKDLARVEATRLRAIRAKNRA
jgi:hypothetical protein